MAQQEESPTSFSEIEKKAIYSLAQIRAAQTDHHANSLAHTYASSLKELYSGEKTNGISLIDLSLASGEREGYKFEIATSKPAEYMGHPRFCAWSVSAMPLESAETGRYQFYCDQSGIIRFSNPDESLVLPEILSIISEEKIREIIIQLDNNSSILKSQ